MQDETRALFRTSAFVLTSRRVTDVIDALVVLVTAPPDRAPELARGLVEAGVAACVNVVPGVRSIYRWQGAVHDDAEALLVIKTTRGGFEALRAEVTARHPYDVPEVLAVPLAAGHAPYLAWIQANVQGGEP